MIELTDTNFDTEVFKSDLPVLVDFWATWCGPCQMVEPAIEELAQEYQGKIKVGKLNVDDNPKKAQELKVMSIPTVIIFSKGKEIERKIGVQSKEEYKRLIEKAIKWSTI